MCIKQFVFCVGTLAMVVPFGAYAGKCGGAAIANGPFKYVAVVGQPTSYTFVGTGGSAITAFTVTAPGPGAVFPAESPGGVCSNTATADIKVFDIEKGIGASAVSIPADSPLGTKIASAFTLSPSSHTFGISEGLTVNVGINNPNVSDSDYGSYTVTMKSQAVGSGVGVGSGFQFALNLQPAADCVDRDAPVISILKPTSAGKILGNIAVRIQAYDPMATCASGLKSVTATVSSSGGAVSNLSIPLKLDQSLPIPAGTTVTGDGVFTPTGASGAAGTAVGPAFTLLNLSGIGTYTLTVAAQDVAGNTQVQSVTFTVSYAVAFTKAFVPPACSTNKLQSCKGQYQFTVRRASSADVDDFSDGAAIFDQTVEGDLVKTSDRTLVISHPYGAGAVMLYVQIDPTSQMYQTDFDHPTGTPYTPYVLKVEFTDVDGQPSLQATSTALWF